MPELEGDAEVDRARRRLAQVNQAIRKLELTAVRIGNVLTSLGATLKTNPGGVIFEKESYQSGFPELCVLKKADQKDVSADAIRALVEDYRKLVTEKQKLEGKLG